MEPTLLLRNNQSQVAVNSVIDSYFCVDHNVVWAKMVNDPSKDPLSSIVWEPVHFRVVEFLMFPVQNDIWDLSNGFKGGFKPFDISPFQTQQESVFEVVCLAAHLTDSVYQTLRAQGLDFGCQCMFKGLTNYSKEHGYTGLGDIPIAYVEPPLNDPGKQAAEALRKLFPDLMDLKVKCPQGCKVAQNPYIASKPVAISRKVWAMIQHLNDLDGWSREKIADWIEWTAAEHGIDITFPTPENVPPEPGEDKMKKALEEE